MRVPDKEIAHAWREKRNYAEVGRLFGGLARQTIRDRVLTLRSQGWDLPPPRKRGYILKDSSEWARKIGQIRKNKC